MQQQQLLLLQQLQLLLLPMLMLLLLHAGAVWKKTSCERSKMKKTNVGQIEPKVGCEKKQRGGQFWVFSQILLRYCSVELNIMQ